MVIASLSQAQQHAPKVKIGEKIKTSGGFSLSDIIGSDESGFYTVQKSNSPFGRVDKVVFEYYNNRLELVKENKVELSYDGNALAYEFTVELKEKLYVFMSYKNSKSKTNYLFAASFNKETLSVSNDLMKVGEISYEGGSVGKLFSGSDIEDYESYRGAYIGEFNYDYSVDSSLIAIYYAMPNDLGEDKRFGVHVLNDNMETLWEKTDQLPYSDKLVDVKDFEVDNQGNFHLLTMVFDGKRKEKSKKESNYKFEMFSYTAKGEKLSRNDLTAGGKFITEMNFEVNKDLELVCAGYYANKSGFHRKADGFWMNANHTNLYEISGYYYQRINAETGEVLMENLTEFSMDFITENMSDKELRKTMRKNSKGKDVGMKIFELRELVLTEDGGVILLGEQYDSWLKTKTSQGGSTTTYMKYFYGEILAIKIDNQGNETWRHKVGKWQEGTRYDMSSFAHVYTNGSLYLFFNDTDLNEDYTDNNELYSCVWGGKHGCTMSVNIDTNGDMHSRKAIIYYDKHKAFVIPTKAKQFGKEMIMVAERGGKQLLIRLNI